MIFRFSIRDKSTPNHYLLLNVIILLSCSFFSDAVRRIDKCEAIIFTLSEGSVQFMIEPGGQSNRKINVIMFTSTDIYYV